jgi:hypothetical protein
MPWPFDTKEGDHDRLHRRFPSDRLRHLRLEDQVVTDEKTYTITVNDFELTAIINALVYRKQRLADLARVALKAGREREALARRECAEQTSALADRLSVIGAEI